MFGEDKYNAFANDALMVAIELENYYWEHVDLSRQMVDADLDERVAASKGLANRYAEKICKYFYETTSAIGPEQLEDMAAILNPLGGTDEDNQPVWTA